MPSASLPIIQAGLHTEDNKNQANKLPRLFVKPGWAGPARLGCWARLSTVITNLPLIRVITQPLCLTWTTVSTELTRKHWRPVKTRKFISMLGSAFCQQQDAKTLSWLMAMASGMLVARTRQRKRFMAKIDWWRLINGTHQMLPYLYQ